MSRSTIVSLILVYVLCSLISLVSADAIVARLTHDCQRTVDYWLVPTSVCARGVPFASAGSYQLICSANGTSVIQFQDTHCQTVETQPTLPNPFNSTLGQCNNSTVPPTTMAPTTSTTSTTTSTSTSTSTSMPTTSSSTSSTSSTTSTTTITTTTGNHGLGGNRLNHYFNLLDSSSTTTATPTSTTSTPSTSTTTTSTPTTSTTTTTIAPLPASYLFMRCDENRAAAASDTEVVYFYADSLCAANRQVQGQAMKSGAFCSNSTQQVSAQYNCSTTETVAVSYFSNNNCSETHLVHTANYASGACIADPSGHYVRVDCGFMESQTAGNAQSLCILDSDCPLDKCCVGNGEQFSLCGLCHNAPSTPSPAVLPFSSACELTSSLAAGDFVTGTNNDRNVSSACVFVVISLLLCLLAMTYSIFKKELNDPLSKLCLSLATRMGSSVFKPMQSGVKAANKSEFTLLSNHLGLWPFYLQSWVTVAAVLMVLTALATDRWSSYLWFDGVIYFGAFSQRYFTWSTTVNYRATCGMCDLGDNLCFAVLGAGIFIILFGIAAVIMLAVSFLNALAAQRLIASVSIKVQSEMDSDAIKRLILKRQARSVKLLYMATFLLFFGVFLMSTGGSFNALSKPLNVSVDASWILCTVSVALLVATSLYASAYLLVLSAALEGDDICQTVLRPSLRARNSLRSRIGLQLTDESASNGAENDNENDRVQSVRLTKLGTQRIVDSNPPPIEDIESGHEFQTDFITKLGKLSSKQNLTSSSSSSAGAKKKKSKKKKVKEEEQTHAEENSENNPFDMREKDDGKENDQDTQ